MAGNDLTAERLRELIDYDPQTGIFTWRVNRGKNKTAGKRAGVVSRSGNICISIDNREYYSHLLAWLYTYGVLPKSKQIIRLNKDRTDNRIANLALYIKSAEREVTLERIQSELDYCLETGVFRWKKAPVNSMKDGDVAGTCDADGYVRIKLGLFNCAAHRLAWLYVHGTWPKHEIDHINGVRNDNRIANLRDVTREENIQNQRQAQKGSRSGFLGVHKNGNNWIAHLQVGGVMRSFGTFKTKEEAHQAYLKAKRKFHTTCTI